LEVGLRTPHLKKGTSDLDGHFHNRNVYRLLAGKPEGKRPLGRPRRGWLDNIKMDLLEIGLIVVGMDWSGSG
jgi:hypothetical protein